MSLIRGCFLLKAFLFLLVTPRCAGLSAAETSGETNADRPIPQEITGRVYVDGQDTPPEKLITLLFLGEKEEEKEEEKDYRINRLVHDNVLASKDGKFTYTIPDNSPVLKSAFFATRNVLDAVYDDKYLGQAIYFGFGDIGPDGKVDIALERAVSELAEVEVRDAGGKRLPRARVFLFVREASAKGIGTPPHTFLPSEILDTDPDGLLRIGVVRSPKSLFYNLMRLKLM